MTFCNILNSLNSMNYFSGMNNWFTPAFSCFNIPNIFNTNIFSNWSMPSFGWNSFPFSTNSSPLFGGFQFPQSQNNWAYNNFSSDSVFNNNTLNANISNTFTPVDTFVYSKPKYDFSEVFSQYQTMTTPYAPSVATSNKSDNNKKKVSGSANNSYVNLSRSVAIQKAKSDANLEELKGGKYWSISSASFITDIPFAKKGTSAILEKVGREIGEKLVITSALGTGEGNSPHIKGGVVSHHNADNPKLDIRTNGNGQQLANKLRATGYFSHILVEKDHLDVQIDSSKFGTA